MNITGVLVNYDLTYTYGFWFIIESNKSFKLPVFLGNEVLLTDIKLLFLYFNYLNS